MTPQVLVGIKRVAREDIGIEYLAERPPQGTDRDPDDRVSRVVVGIKGVGRMASGERKILLLEDFFCCIR